MIRLVAATLFTAVLLSAQSRNPVQWAVDTSSPDFVKVTATMESGWHIYALTSPKGGPTPTTIKLGEAKGVSALKLYQPKPSVKLDPNFNLNVEVFEGSVTYPHRDRSCRGRNRGG